MIDTSILKTVKIPAPQISIADALRMAMTYAKTATEIGATAENMAKSPLLGGKDRAATLTAKGMRVLAIANELNEVARAAMKRESDHDSGK
jgi:molybdenum-dependent DNA-binding transcriptional regulator ModE